MRFLITGGAGFIGSHIAETLLKKSHFVRVMDNFVSGKPENLSFVMPDPRLCHSESALGGRRISENFELIKGDIRDTEACDKACEGIDVISHQAALRSVPVSLKEPESYNDVNIGGTLNLLKSAAKQKVKRLVFASSSSIYGDTRKFPQSEEDIPLLISPYALSKLAGEYYCRVWSEHFGLETVCLRYFNVYGPRQALDDEYAVVIPKFIHCVMNNEKPPIFGNGRQSRDFVYIKNVVEANILSAVFPGIKHEVFNVAGGSDNTILGLIESLNRIIGRNVEPAFLSARAGDVFRTLADISKIKKMLGFKGRINFETGLSETVAYLKRNLQ
jgi:UDP-N-acetylglucosamine/UDP-N-acetylgalactosamine 4-epimerase